MNLFRPLTLVCLAAFALGGCQEPRAGSSTESASSPLGGRVDGPGARALVAAGATLLDVRSGAEFASGHIDGALNIPVQNLESRLAEVPSGAPVVVYCQSGGRAAHAARMLAEAGYEVHDLGSLSAW